jgi:hypothetical protein
MKWGEACAIRHSSRMSEQMPRAEPEGMPSVLALSQAGTAEAAADPLTAE